MLQTQEISAEQLPTLSEWQEALRSDKYEQGQGSLCRNEKYCCIGVYGDLMVKKGLTEWIQSSLKNPIENMKTTKVDMYLEFDNILKNIGCKISTSDFIMYNDDRKMTFEEIACKIEENKVS